MISTAVQFNPFSPEFHYNPYPTYAHLRTEEPVHWSFLGAWVITRYADAELILRDSRFQIDDLPERLKQKSRFLKRGDFNPLSQTIRKWLFFLEPPDHTRLRGLVSKAFAPGMVESMRPQIQEIVDALIGKVQGTGRMDIIPDLASPLPAMMIARILGVPAEDFHKLVEWSHDLFFIFDQPMSLEGYQKQNQVALEAREYFYGLIADQEKKPTGGLLSHLISARDQGKLNQDEILAFCIILFVAGQETTKNLIGNGMLALLHYPDQLEKLKREPGIIQNAVEELLRYDSPVQIIARLAVEDVQIGGKTIRAGDKVLIYLGAVHRDPEKFPDPDRLDISRQNYNLPFGAGIHYCLGATLARIQGQMAISTLVQQLPGLKLNTDKLEWRESITLRGLKSLPVNFYRG